MLSCAPGKKKEDSSAIALLPTIYPLCEIIKNTRFYLVTEFPRFGLNIGINPSHVTGPFLYFLETENQRFSDVFRGYRKRPATRNGLRG